MPSRLRISQTVITDMIIHCISYVERWVIARPRPTIQTGFPTLAEDVVMDKTARRPVSTNRRPYVQTLHVGQMYKFPWPRQFFFVHYGVRVEPKNSGRPNVDYAMPLSAWILGRGNGSPQRLVPMGFRRTCQRYPLNASRIAISADFPQTHGSFAVRTVQLGRE